MAMRKVVWVAAAAGLALGPVVDVTAQERPDFSGTWVVENVDMQRPQGGGGGRGGGRRGGGFGGGMGGDGGLRGSGGGGQGRGGMFEMPYAKGNRFTLKQSAEALIVTSEHDSGMSSYPFDGRETTNPGPGDGTVKSQTGWDGVALVTESSRTVSGPRGEMTIRTREVRTLGPDGRTMTLVTTRELPFGNLTTTVTFTRAEEAR